MQTDWMMRRGGAQWETTLGGAPIVEEESDEVVYCNRCGGQRRVWRFGWGGKVSDWIVAHCRPCWYAGDPDEYNAHMYNLSRMAEIRARKHEARTTTD